MESIKKNNKVNYSSIDLGKFIASLLIIMVHCSPFAFSNELLNNILNNTVIRLAVPFFFACSGFFFFKGLLFENGKIKNCRENRKRLFVYVKRIIILYSIWSILYLPAKIIEWNSINWLSIMSFIDYGISYFCMGTVFHFWYLLNIIYGTIFGYILLSLFNRKTVLVISIILYFMGLFTYSYSWIDLEFINVLFGCTSKLFEIWTSITRGFPLMLFGYIAGLIKDKFSNPKSWGLFLISMLFLTVEFLLLKFFTVNQTSYSYIIFTVPCEIFLFISILNLRNFKLSERVSKILRNASTIIYCIHPMIIMLISNIEYGYKYYIVAVISIVISIILVKLSYIRKFKFLRYLY